MFIEDTDANNLNIVDRKGITISQQEYERLVRDARGRVGDLPQNRISLGSRLETAIAEKIDDNVVNNIIGNLFKSPGAVDAKNQSGIMGTVLRLADTKMGEAFGHEVGSKTTELIKMFGEERIGAMMDAAAGRPVQQAPQQQQLTPEEAQKQEEAIIMSLDSTNIQDVNKFMQFTKIPNLQDAIRVLLESQDKILQKRGLSKGVQQQQPQYQQQPQRQEYNYNYKDMNRNLMQQYENNQNPAAETFFNPNQNQVQPVQQNEAEIILSLNPDFPQSLHQFAAMRQISGVDVNIIKKMLLKEQQFLREQLQATQQVQFAPDEGISPEMDQNRLLGGNAAATNPFLVESQQPAIKAVNAVVVQDPIENILKVITKFDERIVYLVAEVEALKTNSSTRKQYYEGSELQQEPTPQELTPQEPEPQIPEIPPETEVTPEISIYNDENDKKEVGASSIVESSTTIYPPKNSDEAPSSSAEIETKSKPRRKVLRKNYNNQTEEIKESVAENQEGSV